MARLWYFVCVCFLWQQPSQGMSDGYLVDIINRLEALEKEGQLQREHISKQDKRIYELEREIQLLRSKEEEKEEIVINSFQKNVDSDSEDIVDQHHINIGNWQQAERDEDLVDAHHNGIPHGFGKLKLADPQMHDEDIVDEHHNNIPHGFGKQKHVQGGKSITPRKGKRFALDDETVAFHATLSGAARNYHINQKIVFDDELLNLGGGYNSQTGEFTATMSGTYLFSTSVMCLEGQGAEMHAIIMKNGVEIGAAYANGMGGNKEQGSVTVAMKLAVGDQVHVQVGRHDNTGVWGDRLTSFTGVLVMFL
ncbi:uncharacterized protein LOC128232946 [Mya arenaria]|uniref:uncharacterized protein LOC128232946 n=1 Tax=Mya arenaria TaxID=6604 RepID=UPI0022E7D043|nr:uncharacterized protein LOC128232946 [Mya arenaria]XP_052802726.1 uncharacterized protein LOC128232946 [Mya arenaria]